MTKEIIKYTVKEADTIHRLDKLVCIIADVSRNYARMLIDKDCITVNDSLLKGKDKLKQGDQLVISIPQAEQLEVKPIDLSLDIVFEDEYIAVVNKASGLTVHPGAKTKETLVNGLLYQLESLSDINGVIRPGIVHRIDKDTSGLLIIAKTNEAHEKLSHAIAKHEVQRTYIALVKGLLPSAGKINCPLGRSKENRLKMAPDPKGKSAITHFKCLESFNGYSLIECELETGRTHQIRAHLAYIDAPVVNDPIYGKAEDSFGQYLHAYRLKFTHPITELEISLEAPLPAEFTNKITLLKGE